MENDATETEETAAMAEAVSNLSVAADPFSRLPDRVIHQILSFFPSTKAIARTGLVSKQWWRAWLSFPVSNFDLSEFQPPSLPDDQMEAQFRKFVKFVDDTLLRIGGRNSGMQRFNLQSSDAISPHLSRWINIALDNRVEELILRIFINGTDWVPCLLPIRVFSAESITSFTLMGPMVVVPLTLDEISSVNLPSLRSLSFTNCIIDDERLRKILCGCLLLESLSLCDSEFLSEIEISGLPNLKIATVSVSSPTAKLTMIKIKAPKLETFSYNCLSLYHRCVSVRVNHSPDLKSLEMSDPNKGDNWFHQFLANFPRLETLEIESCNGLQSIRISNPNLNLVKIQSCNYLKDILIESKKVMDFRFTGIRMFLPEPTVQMDNPAPHSDAAIFTSFVYWGEILSSNLFFKLNQFLMRSMSFRTYAFFLVAGPSENENLKAHAPKFPTSACRMELLSVGVTAPEASYLCIVNGLLSACHPTKLNLLISEVTQPDFVKFFCEELAKKAPHDHSSCCKEDVKCWKHQIKGVKIIGVTKAQHRGDQKALKGEHGPDLDLPTLIKLVPTLGTDDVAVCLRLVW